MAELNQDGQPVNHPTNIFSIISLGAGIFGWLSAIFIILTGFPVTPLSNYFHFGLLASLFLMTLPGISWLGAILAGRIGVRRIKKVGLQKGLGFAKWGIVMSGIGCVVLYGFLLLVALGFYLAFSKGHF